MNIEKEFSAIMKDMNKNFAPEIFTDRRVYADWLAQTYYFVCHSTSLLGHALPHLKNPEIRHRFEKHISEEERHELMALKDLERLGLKLEDFPEHAATQAFYQSQYYRIQFEGGTSLLGYILFLEGLAVYWAKDFFAQIKNQYPESNLFMQIHTTEDPLHLESAFKSIEALAQHEQEATIRNLQYSHVMYQQIMHCTLRNKNHAYAA
jgi:rubrerythrin